VPPAAQNWCVFRRSVSVLTELPTASLPPRSNRPITAHVLLYLPIPPTRTRLLHSRTRRCLSTQRRCHAPRSCASGPQLARTNKPRRHVSNSVLGTQPTGHC
jgi:hypothetical protein